jgi:hypothetical protein
MSSFVVNTQTLEVLKDAVDALAVELLEGKNLGEKCGFNAIGAGGHINDQQLIFYQFFGAWTNSIGEIGQNMENVSNALGNAAERYFEADHNACDAFLQ